MREVVKSIADRLCDEGLLECLSKYIRLDTYPLMDKVLKETTLRSKVVSFVMTWNI